MNTSYLYLELYLYDLEHLFHVVFPDKHGKTCTDAGKIILKSKQLKTSNCSYDKKVDHHYTFLMTESTNLWRQYQSQLETSAVDCQWISIQHSISAKICKY